MNILNALIFIVLASVPIIVTAKCLCRKESEHIPKKLIVKIIIFEIIFALCAGLVEIYVFRDMVQNNIYTVLVYYIIAIGLTEEIAKFIPAYFLGIKSENCKSYYDSIFLCGISALAFAGFENCFYLIDAKDLIGTGITRGLLSVVGHVLYGLIMGIFISISKYYKKENKKFKYIANIFLAILIPSIYHGIYDYCLNSGNLSTKTIIILFEASLFIYTISIIKYILKNENLDSKKMNTFGIKNIAIIAILIMIIFGLFKYKGEFFEYENKIEESVKINDDIIITVNSTDEVYFDDEEKKGNYVKVNMTISNNGQEDFLFYPEDISLEKDDSETISSDYFERNSEKSKIKTSYFLVYEGETVNGNMYFKTNKSKRMKLIINNINFETLETRKYTIKLY